MDSDVWWYSLCWMFGSILLIQTHQPILPLSHWTFYQSWVCLLWSDVQQGRDKTGHPSARPWPQAYGEQTATGNILQTYAVTITVFIKWQLKKLNKVNFNFHLKSSDRHFLISGSSPLKILLVRLQDVSQLPRKCHIYFLKIRSRKWILSGLPFNTELSFSSFFAWELLPLEAWLLIGRKEVMLFKCLWIN